MSYAINPERESQVVKLTAAYSSKRMAYVDAPDMETYEEMLDSALELAEFLVGAPSPMPSMDWDDDEEPLAGLSGCLQ